VKVKLVQHAKPARSVELYYIYIGRIELKVKMNYSYMNYEPRERAKSPLGCWLERLELEERHWHEAGSSPGCGRRRAAGLPLEAVVVPLLGALAVELAGGEGVAGARVRASAATERTISESAESRGEALGRSALAKYSSNYTNSKLTRLRTPRNRTWSSQRP
jgi:hypothetical protein